MRRKYWCHEAPPKAGKLGLKPDIHHESDSGGEIRTSRRHRAKGSSIHQDASIKTGTVWVKKKKKEKKRLRKLICIGP